MASHIPATRKPLCPQDTGHAPDLERHRRKCSICHHPERETIEQLFLDWHSPSSITEEFDLPDWYTIHRHASVTGLYRRRERNLRSALERVIECADSAPVTSVGIVRAVRAYACLNAAGEWIEPATRVIVSHGQAHAEKTATGDTSAETTLEAFAGPLAQLAAPTPQLPAAVISSDASALPALPHAPAPASPARKGSQVDGESSLGDQGAWGLGHVEAPFVSRVKVRLASRISNPHALGLETALTRSKQRSAPRANHQK